MRIILYDYETERVRGKVRRELKKLGIHAQWSVFESQAEFKEIIRALLDEGESYRVAVFRIDPRGEIKKIGKEWEKVKYIF
ncbi:MAG: CRISPR-associated endonuclease Cas2 [Caldimicrobium sp.]